MTEKKTIELNKDIFKIVLTSIIIGILIVFVANLFSKSWYYKPDRTDIRYELWSKNSGTEGSYKQYEYAKEVDIADFEFNSTFGSIIRKPLGKSEFKWKDFKNDGWSKGSFTRGKFQNPMLTLKYQIFLTFKDWIYILVFSIVIMGLRLFFRKFNLKLK